MTAQERIERAEKELAEAKKMLAKEEKKLYWPDLEPGTFFEFISWDAEKMVKIRDSEGGYVYLRSGNRYTEEAKESPVIVVDIEGNPL